jgi:N-acyl-D-amino-acid deacylase
MVFSTEKNLIHHRLRFLMLLAILPLVWQAAMLHGSESPMYDLLIEHGHIIDGTGSPWFEGSVAINGDKIVAVGRLEHASARKVLDAQGQVVAPGFIDLHSHSDFTLLVDGNAESKIRQGVTTEILGESGSAGPVEGAGDSDLDLQLAPLGLHRDWKSLGEYFARLLRQGISVNIASYVGSGQVRLDVTGNINRVPTASEMQRMKQLVDEAMLDGAIGLGSGLIYPPNSYASRDELVELARVSARHGGIYTTHMRSEGAGSPAAIDEAIEIGRMAGLPVHILHLKSYGASNWGRMPSLVRQIQSARDQGLDITADIYPYVATETGLNMTLPSKYLEGTPDQVLQRLKDPATRNAIRDELKNGPSEGTEAGAVGGWHNVLVGSIQSPEFKKYEGKRVDEISTLMKKDPVDAVCALLVADHGLTPAIYFAMTESDVREALRQPWVGIGSDGQAVNPSMPFVGKPHPRYYGTFPRVLGYYVREEKVLSLPDAIRKMTSLPAQIVGLEDRGVLRPGMAADVTIFDPDMVKDRATFSDPNQYPVGINFVIVNGIVVLAHGEHTMARPGRLLYGRGKR